MSEARHIEGCDRTAADAGATAWSTAGFYGNPGDGQSNLKLIRKFFDKVRAIPLRLKLPSQILSTANSIPSTGTRSFSLSRALWTRKYT